MLSDQRYVVRRDPTVYATYNHVPIAGPLASRYVFGFVFAKCDCVASPQLEMWDTWEDAQAGLSPTTPPLIGTAEYFNPWFAAIDTTFAAPPLDSWHPAVPFAGGHSPNVLSGRKHFLKFGAIPKIGDTLYWNWAARVPWDAEDGAYEQIVLLRVFYSGDTPPTITWKANFGSEDTPAGCSTTLTPGASGHKLGIGEYISRPGYIRKG